LTEQKRSCKVWKITEVLKTEFNKLSEPLDKVNNPSYTAFAESVLELPQVDQSSEEGLKNNSYIN
jgi:hypothetical protein